MVGYVFSSMDCKTLREFAEKEYPEVNWTNFGGQDEEGIDLWGWLPSGGFIVAVAVPFYSPEEEVKKPRGMKLADKNTSINQKTSTPENRFEDISDIETILDQILSSSPEIEPVPVGIWKVRFISESEGLITKLSKEFLKTKPRHLKRIK
ncbi:hypothetical protein N752_29890 [Desulforamulus aquiferis]|nr:hypothetical protein [Desulforamulus aquiferis]RYD01515.1 hypothetical protein N752_29890 [Desulforamulus aquiferis]